jgi:hypothetical protein
MKKLKTLIISAAIAASLTLTPILKAEDVSLKAPDYKPLSNLIGQEFKNYPTQDGMWPCVVFPYDRNEDGKKDMVEVRRMTLNQNKDPIWEEKPYVLIIDDDFDGLADRVLADVDRDGKFDKGEDLRPKKISMEEY